MPKTETPSTNGDNGDGRDARGRFTPGNPGGPGNPYVRVVASWRNAFVSEVSPDDVGAVIRALVAAAKRGEPWAVREVLDRCLGKPRQAEERAEDETPPAVKVNLDLSRMLANRMREALEQPSVPGLPPPRLAPPAPREDPPDAPSAAGLA